jgi:putative glutathione S-transferase
MAQLKESGWRNPWFGTTATNGRFVRSESQFRNWVTPAGSPGPTGYSGFEAEAGRYHLYVSLACPWSHRAVIFRALKGLEGIISMSVTHWFMGSDGWTFQPGPGVIADSVLGARRMYDVYAATDRHYAGRVTVPVLWDRKLATIVSNESADIIRMMNSAFDGVLDTKEGDYYPDALRGEIDEINLEIYDRINNGVYKAGFATTQAAYDEAVGPMFVTLDRLEALLSERRYLCGSQVTEADWRLFVTLVRFDTVYVGHFKCNVRTIADYPSLSAYMRELFQHPGIAETVDFRHIRRHYYESHRSINPTGIVPAGPSHDMWEPHGRSNALPFQA